MQSQTPQTEAKHILATFDQLVGGQISYELLSITVIKLFQESKFDTIRQNAQEVKRCTDQHCPQSSLQNYTATLELRKDIRKILNSINE